jgi:thiamine biosynthesis lipoprotein
MIGKLFLCYATLLVCLSQPTNSPPPAELERYEFEHAAMGVNFRYIIYCEQKETAEKLFAAAQQRVEELNQTLSDYLEQSETNQLCRSAPHPQPQRVSPDLYRVVSRSLEFSRLTSGDFDVTVGPASHAWRKAIKRNRLPTAEKIAELLPAIGAEKVELTSPNQIRLTAPNMQLDFGGIAQGDAADQIAAIFIAGGIKSALIDASGDIRAIGSPPDTAGWPIEIPGLAPDASKTVCLKDVAISTSGDREQRLVIDGIRYSHIVDPRTAVAVKQSVEATVIAPDATTADALASALCVLSLEEGRKLVASLPDVEAQWIIPGDTAAAGTAKQPQVIRSERFEKWSQGGEEGTTNRH